MELILTLGIIALFTWGCHSLAGTRNRNQIGWAFGGFFFGIFAVVLLLILGEAKEV